MKMHKNIFVGFMALCVASPAFADKVSGEVSTSWGNPSVKKCISTFPTEFSIDEDGQFQEKINVLLPRTINGNGVEFCPMLIASYRSSTTKRPELYAYYAKGKSAADCFWVCKDGFGGKNCSVDYSTGAQTCDAVPLDIPRMSGNDDNGSAKVAYFFKDHYDCSNKVNERKTSDQNNYHYVTMGVEKILEHGVISRPVTIRAFGEKSESGWNYALMEPIGADFHLLCKNGYKPNVDNSDCVPIDSVLCDTTPICNGWDHEIFKDREMYKRQNAKEKYKVLSKRERERSCIQYRCAQSGYGFAGDPTATDDAGRECVACPPDGYYGTISPNGRCEMSPLEDGKAVEYDEKGNVVQFELEKTRKRDMTEQTYKGKPCWQYLLDGDDEFKACLLANKVQVAVDDDKPASSKPVVDIQLPVVKF
ncbi:MAG: hypothetical protein IKL37_03850 [Alphaproteobacteria bacterium]|nr:hypothetical protein [Alphaproteobacteria bacterium]MBR6685373.1 hypothetical protein [Alphaproteobacteria bacterium]